MLIKKELLKIPILPHPTDEACAITDQNMIHLVANAEVVRNDKCGELLVIDFYDQKDGARHVGRYFCDCISGNAIAYFPIPNKWSQRRLHDVLGRATCTKAVHDLCLARMKDTKAGAECYWWDASTDICGLADQLSASRGVMKRASYSASKERQREAFFSSMPNYPAALSTFCENVVFKDSFIFVSKLKCEKRSAVCSHCGHQFCADKSAKHGSMLICPACGRESVCYGDWYGRCRIETSKDVFLTQRNTDGTLLLRWTKAHRNFSRGVAAYIFVDTNRTFQTVRNGKRHFYSYKMANIPYYGWDWCRRIDELPDHHYAYVFPPGINDAFPDEAVRRNFNLEDELQKVSVAIDIIGLLMNLETTHGVVEYMMRLGMTTLACTIHDHHIQAAGTSFSTVLGINGQYLSLYRKHDVTLEEHMIVKCCSERGIFVHEEAFLQYRKLYALDHLAYGDVIDILSFMPLDKFNAYFQKQRELCGMPIPRLMLLYKDYRGLLAGLGIEDSAKSVRFPANIVEAHDRLVVRYNAAKKEIEDTRIAQANKFLKAGIPEFSRDGLTVRMPESRADFLREGTALSHCVGQKRYFDSHVSGERMIFFIRKQQEPDKPYYTMEIDMKRMVIIQLYGYGDCQAPTGVRDFANKFLRKIQPKSRRVGAA